METEEDSITGESEYAVMDGARTKKIAKAYAFFFSSRRRHTRFTSDWSSDVCSSDLELASGAKDTLCPFLPRRDPGGELRSAAEARAAVKDRKSVG